MKIEVLIIDDEELARLLLKESLKEIPWIEVVGEAGNGFDALKLIAEKKPKLLFLDVQMPKLTGFEMLELLDDKPEIIFITAFDQYALEAFEQNAVDYLLKPFTNKRLQEAVKRAGDRLQSGEVSHKAPALQEKLDDAEGYIDRVVIRTGKKIRIIPVEEIKYLEADDDYVSIMLEGEKHLKQKTMRFYESHLDPKEFVRIHRGYIVRIQFVDSIELYEKDSYIVKLKDGQTLPVSKNGYVKLRDSLRF